MGIYSDYFCVCVCLCVKTHWTNRLCVWFHLLNVFFFCWKHHFLTDLSAVTKRDHRAFLSSLSNRSSPQKYCDEEMFSVQKISQSTSCCKHLLWNSFGFFGNFASIPELLIFSLLLLCMLNHLLCAHTNRGLICYCNFYNVICNGLQVNTRN